MFRTFGSSQILQNLCQRYRDPATGLNTCEGLVMDSRCKTNVNEDIYTILSSALCLNSNNVCSNEQMYQQTFCSCPCWSEIRHVFSGIFHQLKDSFALLATKLDGLSNLCLANQQQSLQVNVVETSDVQCATNDVVFTLSSTSRIPKGTNITIRGLNADLLVDYPIVDNLQVELPWKFIPAKCHSWCDMTSVPYLMYNKPECVEWCDEDSIISVRMLSDIPPIGQFTLKFRFINSPYSRIERKLSVAASGPEFNSPITSVIYQAGMQGVLASKHSPTFTAASVQIPPSSSDFFDGNVWRGSSWGMTVSFHYSVTPNIDLPAGSMITITGFFTAKADVPSPVLSGQSIKLLRTTFWDPNAGVLLLEVLPEGTLPAGLATQFSLELDTSNLHMMDLVMLQSISATLPQNEMNQWCSLPLKNFSLPQLSYTSNPVIRNPSLDSSTCDPGVCSSFVLKFAVSGYLNSSTYTSIVLEGLFNTSRSDSCISIGSACSSEASIPLLDDGKVFLSILTSANLNFQVMVVIVYFRGQMDNYPLLHGIH